VDVILLQLLNGLDKGGAYALIALGLTLTFGTLGIVNFAHGALFMLGAFCAVTVKSVLSMQMIALDPTKKNGLGHTAGNQDALRRSLVR
jgi:branched-subunit amino acid ABC-type transport system permease component